MHADDILKVKELFESALARDPAERSAFLDQACSDDRTLCEKVKSLLASAESLPDFLEKPAWDPFLKVPSRSRDGEPELDVESNLPYERLGEFKLIGRIGEGGMGVVYLAVQESLGRKAALKIIHPDRSGSFETTARFWREVEALSVLNHPNIVTIYGSGEERGVRYFAMELVSGRGLEDELRDAASHGKKVAALRALTWVKEIAEALECVHQAGIIHRDVKPSNIRITPSDRAILMDFGVARHMQRSALTITGQFRGTPHYASPEQVKARRHKIDHRTDIYSLGVTLYELVAGYIPFKGETTEQVFRQILEKEPLAPRRINPAISRDLETIILTAMDKEPDRRYQTMREFADDIDRLLRGEMIQAKPISLATKFLKRVKKSPVVSLVFGVAVLAVLALIVSVPLYLVRIKDERDKALKATHDAESQKILALDAKDQAVEAMNIAIEEEEKKGRINEFFKKMFASADPGMSGKDVTVVQVLDLAHERLTFEFADQPEIEASLRDTIGKTYLSLGKYDPAKEQFSRALEICCRQYGESSLETLALRSNLASVHLKLGKLHLAKSQYLDVLDARRHLLGDEHEETQTSMSNLAVTCWNMGEQAEAEKLLRELLEIRRICLPPGDTKIAATMNELAKVLWGQQNYSEAESFFREALAIQTEASSEEHPRTLGMMNDFGSFLWNMQRHHDAEALLTKTVEIRRRILPEDHPDTITSMLNLANVYTSLGKLAEAESLHRQSLEGYRRVLPPDHPNILKSLTNLAGVIMVQGKVAVAAPLFQEVVDVASKTSGENNPFVLQAKLSYGLCLLKLERFQEAETPLLESYCGWKAARGPKNQDTRAALCQLIKLYDLWEKPEKSAEYRALRQ